MSKRPPPDRSRFKFSTEIRVRLNETDAVGIIFHGHYFTYMDVGRVDYLRNLDLMESGRPIRGFDNVVVHSSCDFRSPARYDDPVVVWVRVAELRTSSFAFEFLFFHKRTNALLASGRSIHCAVDLETMEKGALPSFFAAALRDYEGAELSDT
jgi:acyl-CoA thioester hydrolase